MARERCFWSGSVDGANEAQRIVRCPCGFSAEAAPRFNRRVAGEVVPGWSIKMPAHSPGKSGKHR